MQAYTGRVSRLRIGGLYDQLRQAIQQNQLIPDGARLVVGVSGGADSLALLHALHALAPAAGWHLHVATLDHGLRGAAGAADADYVRGLCVAWGLPVTVGQADVRSAGGIEAAARRARYDFLAAVAHEVGAGIVAVAHHADDQAETVLLRLLRGTGLRGLRGMALTSPLPFHPELQVVRPLLFTPRRQIDDYCRQHALLPREDATNADTTLLRNAVRHQLLPLLETLAPPIRQSLIRLAETAALEDDYLSLELRRLWESSACVNTADSAAIRREVFRALHPALQRRWVIGAVEQVAGAEWVDHVHVLAARRIALSGRQGARAQFAGGAHLRVDYDFVRVEKAEQVIAAFLLPPDTDVPLPVPGVLRMASIEIGVETVPVGTAGALGIPQGVLLRLRTRREGDRFAPQGMGGHTRKLSRWMGDRHVPLAQRDGLPLLEIAGEVVAVWWEQCWQISARWATRSSDEPVYQIRLGVI
jgi:tRNA(Ile)-lysidine synthase